MPGDPRRGPASLQFGVYGPAIDQEGLLQSLLDNAEAISAAPNFYIRKVISWGP